MKKHHLTFQNCYTYANILVYLKYCITIVVNRVVKGSDDMPVNLKINKEMNNFEGGVMAKFERRE